MSVRPKRGMVAAGHRVTAEAGAEILRAGGNAVDAAVAAMLASFVAEPLLTGLGAGGYMLVCGAGEEPALLDFFVEAPGRGADPARRAPLLPVDVSFGDANQIFYVGASSVGTYGVPAGVCAAMERWGSMPLAELAAPAAGRARAGVTLNAQQAYVAEILGELLVSTPEASSRWAPGGRALREGATFRDPELADAIERLGSEGDRPFYEGDVAEDVVAWLGERGGMVTAEDLRAYRAVVREPVRVPYRGRDVLTNPPPSAGGILLAYALALLERRPSPPALDDVIEAMHAAQTERTPAFLDGLPSPGFQERFLASRLGSTTHISVLDTEGRACSVTATNGEGSGVHVPGTGLHLNNVMGEQDLSPLGFHRHAPGTRMPSMMAPTVVLADEEVELVLGSAGSNRIRSALLQTVIGVVDHGLGAGEAVDAPRVHVEEGVLYAEPGVLLEEEGEGEGDWVLSRFRAANLFFGGVQAVACDRASGEVSGAGDPRRGGVAVAQ